MEAEGISVEVIDLRTVAPLDMEPILASVHKTSRLLIAHEAVVPFGIGAEIAATVAREGFWDLDAPIERIGAGPDAVALLARPRAGLAARSRATSPTPCAGWRRCSAAGWRPPPQQPSCRAMTRCWISLVPSPISSTLASQ